MGIVSDFKSFALRGNVADLAVGVVIGAAFGKIVSSLVADIVTPPLGLLLGGVNFTDIKVPLKEAVVDAAGKIVSPAISLNVGNFLQSLFDFFIVSMAIFVVVRVISALHRKKEQEPAAPAVVPAPTRQEVLLQEIRDALLKRG